jgi:predicted anti-sigma-YlaC factor YlaD
MSRFGLSQCENVRVWAALAPDGELSELERRALRSHVRQCGSCARFAQGVEQISVLLRAEELEQPSFSPLIPRVTRRRHAFAARARTVTAAAAVALMALGIASRSPLDVDGRDAADRTTTAAAPTPAAPQRDAVRAWSQGELLQLDVRPLERSASLGRNQPV